MYGGHFGFALVGRSAASGIPLSVLVPAAFAPDLLRLCLALAGLSPPAAVAVGASVTTTLVLAGVAGLGWGWGRGDPGAGVVLGLVVTSHALGDVVEQTVDLWPWGPEVGLDLVEVPVLNHSVQVAMVAAAWLLYRRSLSGGGRRTTPPAAWAILFVVLAFHGGSILVRSAFGG